MGPVAQRDARTATVAFGAATCAVWAARLVEFEASLGPSPRSVAVGVAEGAPVPLLLALLSGLLGWAASRLVGSGPARRALAGTAAALASFAALAVLARSAFPWWVTGWLDPGALPFLWADLLAVALAAALAFGALAAAGERRWPGRLARAFAVALAVAAVAVPLVDLAAFAGTGALGGYFAVQEVLSSGPLQLAPVLLSAVDGRAVGTAVGALAAAGGVAIAARYRTGSRAGRPPEERAAVPARAAFAVVAPLAVALLAVPAALPSSAGQSSVLRFARTAYSDARFDVGALEEGVRPAHDLRSARLVLPEPGRRPNVVVVVLESVRATAVGAYVPGLRTTPFLDSLAAAGVLVEDLTTTTPSTNKALVSIFGGVPPNPVSEVVEAEPGGVPSPGLAGALRPHGYRSAFFTPATLAYERKDRLLANLGFEEAFGDGDFPTAGFERKAYFGYEDRIVLAPALRWAAERSAAGDPFVLGLLTLSAHHPYDVPASARRLGLETGDADRDAYYDAVRYTDDFLRDLVGGLEALGVMGSTALVVVGDHGQAFGEHTDRTHGNVIWDDVLRVPGVVYAPGLLPGAAGRVVRGPHQVTDVLPTVADLAGGRWEGAELPGRSLLRDAPPGRTLFHATKNGRVAVAVRRDGRKAVYRYGREPTQLFDLRADPGERRDTAADAEPADLLGFERDAQRWLRDVHAAYGT